VDNKIEHEMSSYSPTNSMPPLGNSRHFHTKREEPSSNKNHHEYSAKLVTKTSMEILGKKFYYHNNYYGF
jgi:hypothetical protein